MDRNVRPSAHAVDCRAEGFGGVREIVLKYLGFLSLLVIAGVVLQPAGRAVQKTLAGIPKPNPSAAHSSVPQTAHTLPDLSSSVPDRREIVDENRGGRPASRDVVELQRTDAGYWRALKAFGRGAIHASIEPFLTYFTRPLAQLPAHALGLAALVAGDPSTLHKRILGGLVESLYRCAHGRASWECAGGYAAFAAPMLLATGAGVLFAAPKRSVRAMPHDRERYRLREHERCDRRRPWRIVGCGGGRSISRPPGNPHPRTSARPARPRELPALGMVPPVLANIPPRLDAVGEGRRARKLEPKDRDVPGRRRKPRPASHRPSSIARRGVWHHG